jgi:macrolide transport system ATP-binding/permease protein
VSFDRWRYIVPLRVRSLFGRRRLDDELDEEIAYHLERQIEANLADGMSAEEARRAAIKRFGGVTQRKEEARDRRRVSLLEDLWQDVGYGVRILRKSPRFTVVAVASLAIGIGATTAIFNLIDALRLRPLPVMEPERLAIVRVPNRVGASGSFDSRYPDLTYPLWEQLRAR